MDEKRFVRKEIIADRKLILDSNVNINFVLVCIKVNIVVQMEVMVEVNNVIVGVIVVSLNLDITYFSVFLVSVLKN